MMQAANHGNRDDRSFSWRIYCPPHRCIPIQGTVRPRSVVIVLVLLKDAPEVCFDQRLLRSRSSPGPSRRTLAGIGSWT